MQQETKMVAMYDVPIGDEYEKITLQFPGDVVGSSSRQIATKRVGSQSVVFNTPSISPSPMVKLPKTCESYPNGTTSVTANVGRP